MPFFYDLFIFDHATFRKYDPHGFAGEKRFYDQMISIRICCGDSADVIHIAAKGALKKFSCRKRPDGCLSQPEKMGGQNKCLNPGKMVDHKNVVADRDADTRGKQLDNLQKEIETIKVAEEPVDNVSISI